MARVDMLQTGKKEIKDVQNETNVYNVSYFTDVKYGITVSALGDGRPSA